MGPHEVPVDPPVPLLAWELDELDALDVVDALDVAEALEVVELLDEVEVLDAVDELEAPPNPPAPLAPLLVSPMVVDVRIVPAHAVNAIPAVMMPAMPFALMGRLYTTGLRPAFAVEHTRSNICCSLPAGRGRRHRGALGSGVT
jgi:hypothetical protein